MNKRYKVCVVISALSLSLCGYALFGTKASVDTDATETAEVDYTMSEIDSDVPVIETVDIETVELNLETLKDVNERIDETVYATHVVNIRKEPSIDSEKVGKLTWFEPVNRIGHVGEGSKVFIDGSEHYVASEYLTTEEPPMPNNEDNSKFVYLGEFKVTAYCGGSCCNGKGAGTTSTGASPSEGRTIAVAPWVIPYGSQVYIDGVGYRTAEDTGGFANRNSHQIDLFIASHSRTSSWGVQYRNVWIVK